MCGLCAAIANAIYNATEKGPPAFLMKSGYNNLTDVHSDQGAEKYLNAYATVKLMKRVFKTLIHNMI